MNDSSNHDEQDSIIAYKNEQYPPHFQKIAKGVMAEQAICKLSMAALKSAK